MLAAFCLASIFANIPCRRHLTSTCSCEVQDEEEHIAVAPYGRNGAPIRTRSDDTNRANWPGMRLVGRSQTKAEIDWNMGQ